MTSNETIYNKGSWTNEEKQKFKIIILQHGKDFNELINQIKTRKISQIRSHSQKELLKICRKLEMNGSSIKEDCIKEYLKVNIDLKQRLDEYELKMICLFEKQIPWRQLKKRNVKKRMKMKMEKTCSFEYFYEKEKEKIERKVFMKCMERVFFKINELNRKFDVINQRLIMKFEGK